MSVINPLLGAVPHTPSSGVRLLARFGFAAIGVVYGLMGLLTLLAATGQRPGGSTDKEDAVQHLEAVPGGSVLLGLIAFGLLGYIVWRFTQAVLDTEGKGNGATGLGRRLGYIASGVFYSGLALYAGRLALHQPTAQTQGQATEGLTARVLSWPGGNWLILLTGLVIIGIGVYQLYRAYSGKFQKDVNASSLSAGQQRLVYRTGQVGFTARAIVLGIIGYFFVQAGLQSRAGAVGSTGEAFNLLATMGPAVLAVVAGGLLAYGLYMLVQARYPVLRGI